MSTPSSTPLKPQNLLFILSDQHNRKLMGCQGHDVVKTPNLDLLAAGGTRFTSAYTHSPICVPARASLHTGRNLQDIRFWDNALPYDGTVTSWAHRLREAGHEVVSIGKLHFRSDKDDNGWSNERLSMHVAEGRGDVLGSIRDEWISKPKVREVVEKAGGGDSSYTRYDRNITTDAVEWIKAHARDASADQGGKPWCLFVSLVAPHPPLMAPEAFYDMYPHDAVPWPAQATPEEGWPMHPAIAGYRKAYRFEPPHAPAEIRKAIAAYMGLVSFLDNNVGELLAALNEAGLRDSTRVMYSSDHGDNMGNHGLWNKNVLYEDAAGVPLILSGEGVPAGKVVDTPATLLDAFPTIQDAVGCAPAQEDTDLPGQSLWQLANGERRKKPVLLAQYHASGSITGGYLVRQGPYKAIHYATFPPQLFNVVEDPHETKDLASDPAHAATLKDTEAALREVCDPAAIDQLAHADQAALVERWGGKAAVIAKGGFGSSPVPGEKPEYVVAP